MTAPPVATSSSLTPLLRQALDHVPTAERTQTARVAVALQSGLGEREAAHRLGITWNQLASLRSGLQDGMVSALRADGYADIEIRCYLGVASVSAAPSSGAGAAVGRAP